MTVGREFETPVVPGNDHAEKTMLLQKRPNLWRKVQSFVSDVPVVDHRAQLFYRALDKSPLFVA